jgi:hypothetical protein
MATCHEMIGRNTGTSTFPTRRNTPIYAYTILRTLPTCDTNLGSQTVATREARDFVESLEPTCKHSLPAPCYIPAFSYTFLSCTMNLSCGPCSVVGIAIDYGLDGPGIVSRWGARFSAPFQADPGAHPASFKMGTASFPGGYRLPGRGAAPPHTI